MRAFSISNVSKIHVYKEPVKMVYSFDGLADLIKADGHDPFSGDLFVFVNTGKTYIKVFYAHDDTHRIFAARVPHGTFDMLDRRKTLTLTELQNLIDRIITNGGKDLPHLKVAKKEAA